MKSGHTHLAAKPLLLLATMLLAACASRAPEFGGRWRDANAYAQTPQEITLQQAYVYAASPTDGTLRNLLQRWTRDAGLRLRYGHRSDYTLHTAVARIRTPDLRQAVALLSHAYAAQGVAVTVDDDGVSVGPAETVAPSPGQ